MYPLITPSQKRWGGTCTRVPPWRHCPRLLGYKITRRTWESGLRLRQCVTVNDVRHLAAARRVVRHDAEVVDGATRQVVVHQTDSTVRAWRPTASASFTGRLEVDHVLCTSHHHIPPDSFHSLLAHDMHIIVSKVAVDLYSTSSQTPLRCATASHKSALAWSLLASPFSQAPAPHCEITKHV